MLWLLLWAVVQVTHLFRIDGPAVEYIHHVHTTVTLLLFALFSGFLLFDFWEIYTNTRSGRMTRAETLRKKLLAEAMMPQ
jgi:hypothetical protein